MKGQRLLYRSHTGSHLRSRRAVSSWFYQKPSHTRASGEWVGLVLPITFSSFQRVFLMNWSTTAHFCLLDWLRYAS